MARKTLVPLRDVSASRCVFVLVDRMPQSWAGPGREAQAEAEGLEKQINQEPRCGIAEQSQY